MTKALEFREFLEKKLGKPIVKAMLEPGEQLQLRKGCKDALYRRGLVEHNSQKVKELVSAYADKIAGEAWAFDFPGWIGVLDFSNVSVKEVMVIGMEPHIGSEKHPAGDRNVQATYGLRETAEGEFGEIDEYKPNTRLWKNLHGLFGAGEDYQSYDFLSKFYITDMSHFAIQGKAKEINRIKEWSQIRESVAKVFLPREIHFIKPRYIVSQSNPVADFVEKLLGQYIEKKSTRDFKMELPKGCTNSPAFKKYEIGGQTVIHLRLPHLASGMTNYFWIPADAKAELRKKRLSQLKMELDAFENSSLAVV